MWQLVRSLRDTGVTIILITHCINEAEEMADSIGVISNGEIMLVEDRAESMRKLGKKQMTLQRQDALERIPSGLSAFNLALSGNGSELIYAHDAHDTRGGRPGIAALARQHRLPLLSLDAHFRAVQGLELATPAP